jgi:hypothetical protein
MFPHITLSIFQMFLSILIYGGYIVIISASFIILVRDIPLIFAAQPALFVILIFLIYIFQHSDPSFANIFNTIYLQCWKIYRKVLIRYLFRSHYFISSERSLIVKVKEID